MDGGRIKVKPSGKAAAGITEALEFQRSDLRKYFEVGNHVRTLGGLHEGKLGWAGRGGSLLEYSAFSTCFALRRASLHGTKFAN